MDPRGPTIHFPRRRSGRNREGLRGASRRRSHAGNPPRAEGAHARSPRGAGAHRRPRSHGSPPPPAARPSPSPPAAPPSPGLARTRAELRLRLRPPELAPLAPAAEHASYLLVERDGLVLIVPVLAAVGGTGLHHPSGPPHFPSAREAGGGGGEGRGTGALGARRARLRHARCFRWLWSAVPGAMASPAGG